MEKNYTLTTISHQLTALAFMIEKEYRILDHPQFPSLWDISNSMGSKGQLVPLCSMQYTM